MPQSTINAGLIILERVFAHDFTALRILADASCFRPIRFATHCAELRRFAAKNSQAVENDRENHCKTTLRGFVAESVFLKASFRRVFGQL
jgi:hypothetical protein